MASFIPFNCFALDLGKKVHHLDSDTLKLCLTDTAPDVAANLTYSDIVDLATSGGYTAGGISLGSCTWTQSGGLATLAPGVSPVWTASTGFGPFRYLVLYNFTAASKNLIAYYDNGAPISIAATKDFDANYGAAVLTLHF